jgi:autotransporter-associated beta strand protein
MQTTLANPLAQPAPSSVACRKALLLALIIFCFGAAAVRAADGTWTNTSGGLWSNTANWSGGTIANGSGFTANFNTLNITADTTVSLDGDRTLTNLIFGDTTPATAGSWILDNNGVSTNNLILAGATPTITVNALGTGKTASISAIIEGTAGLTKAGTGTLTLSGANTYTGTTTVSAGVLRLDSANALPGGIDTTVGAGESALTLAGGVLGLGNGDFTRALGTGAGQVNITTTLSGFAAYGADRNVNLGGASAGVSWATGNFFSGTSTLVLGASSATHTVHFQNPINLNGGNRIVQVDDGAASVDANLSGAITAGSFSLTKTGAGTLQLSSTGNTYLGGTLVESGTLRLGASGVIPDTGAVTVRRATTAGSTDGVLDLNGFNETIAVLTLGSATTTAANAGQTPSVINSSATAATLTLGGTVTYNAGTASFENGQATISANLDLASASRGIVVGNGAAVDDLVISGAILSGGFVQSGLGTLRLDNPANAHANSVIRDGTLKLGANSVLGTGTVLLDQRVAGTATLDLNGKTDAVGTTLQLSSGSTTALGALNQITDSAGGGLLALNGTATYFAGAATFNNGTTTISAALDLNGATRTFAINDSNQTTQEVIISGAIQGTGAGLTKTQAGTLVLSGTNTYNGGTTISAGTLQLGNGGTTGALTSTSAVTNNASLIVNRSNAFTQATGLNGQAITGTGSFTQAGPGTTTLSVANSYSGTTTISTGVLEVTANNALGTAAAGTSVTNGAALKLTNVSYSTAEAVTLNGTGISNGGALVNSGTSSFAGQITAATNASINAGGGTLTLSGGLVKDGTTLTLTGGGRINVSVTGISGASSNSDLIVDGTTVVVSANSNYNGPTTVQNSGTLVANAAVTSTQVTISANSTLSGTGSITTGSNNYIYLNGTLQVGDSTLGSPVASSFELNTSGTGSTVMGVSSSIYFDLFTRGGDLTATTTAADYIKLFGSLDPALGGTLFINNPNSLSGFAAGDKWTLFDLTGGGSISNTLALDYTSLLLGPTMTGSFDNGTGVFSIIAIEVPEPSRALLLMLGLAGLVTRRRRR